MKVTIEGRDDSGRLSVSEGDNCVILESKGGKYDEQVRIFLSAVSTRVLIASLTQAIEGDEDV